LLEWGRGITGIGAILVGTAEAGIAAGTVMIFVDADPAEIGIMTAGAAENFMAMAGFAVNMGFAVATSSTETAVSTEIAVGSMAAAMVGGDKALGSRR